MVLIDVLSCEFLVSRSLFFFFLVGGGSEAFVSGGNPRPACGFKNLQARPSDVALCTFFSEWPVGLVSDCSSEF